MTLKDMAQDRKLELAFMGLAALGGIVAILVFYEKSKHRKIEAEILQLDKMIKELQLKKLQSTN